MKNSRFQTLTQTVGILTLVALAMLGLLSILGYSTPFAAAQDVAPPAESVESADLRAVNANPAIPATFNYQGTLRNADGSLNNSTRHIIARIWTSATEGSALYTEAFPNTQVRDGQFNIVLGDNPGGQNLLNAFNTAPLYIEISIDDVPQIPRERVHGVPWAINATNAFDGVPVGGVIDWWRPVNNDTLFPIPDGFLVCNGQTVNDQASPLNGYALPDFQDKYVLGTIYPFAIGNTGGTFYPSHTTGSAGTHNHNVIDVITHPGIPNDIDVFRYDENGNRVWTQWWTPDGVGTDGGGKFYFGGDLSVARPMYWGTSNDGYHSHTVDVGAHIPPYISALKLCRIR